MRYLSSKKSVDDRALNNHVRGRLAAALPGSSPKNALKVLELGAGIGTMIERLVDWRLLTFADYTAIDSDANCIGVWPAGLNPKALISAAVRKIRRLFEPNQVANAELIFIARYLDLLVRMPD